MHEIGLDMSSHEPKSFDDLNSGFYDAVISFSREAHDAQCLTKNNDYKPITRTSWHLLGSGENAAGISSGAMTLSNSASIW